MSTKICDHGFLNSNKQKKKSTGSISQAWVRFLNVDKQEELVQSGARSQVFQGEVDGSKIEIE